MLIIAVSSDPAELTRLAEGLSELRSDVTVISFSDPLMAFKYAVQNPADFLFADYRMRRLTGTELAGYIIKHRRRLKVCLLCDETDYSDSAKLPQYYYIKKPLDANALAVAMARAEE